MDDGWHVAGIDAEMIGAFSGETICRVSSSISSIVGRTIAFAVPPPADHNCLLARISHEALELARVKRRSCPDGIWLVEYEHFNKHSIETLCRSIPAQSIHDRTSLKLTGRIGVHTAQSRMNGCPSSLSNNQRMKSNALPQGQDPAAQ